MPPETHSAVEAQELRYSYVAGSEVLAGVSHRFEPGRVTAVVGPNGAGKSTLLKLLAGVMRPTVGRVVLGGASIDSLTTTQRARRLVYIPQRSNIAFPFSVRQVVAMGRYAAGEGPSAASVGRALEAVDLIRSADAPIGTLSVGQQQRATLARAIAQMDGGDGTPAAAALLADEPVSAMDPAHAMSTMRILRGLAGQGVAVVVVLHDLGLAIRCADEAVLLGETGVVAAAGPVDTTLTPERAMSVFGTRFVELTDPEGHRAGLAPVLAEHAPG